MDTIYLAAVLFRLADLGVPVGVIGAVAALIKGPHRTKPKREFRQFWQEAKALTNPVPAYLGIAPVPGQEEVAYYLRSLGSFQVNDGLAWAVINLTVTFGQLKR